MHLDENQLRYIFSKKNVKRYFFILVLIIIGLFTVLFIVTTHVFDSNKEFYYSQLSSVEQYKTNDIRLLCSIISCDKAYIAENNVTYEYKRKDGSLTKIEPDDIPVSILGAISTDFSTIVRYKNYEFVIDNDSPADLVVKLFSTLSLILWITFSVIFYNFSARQYKEELYDKGNLKNYIENKSQRSITEMIHHEMVAPIAVIRSEVEAIYKAIYNENCQYKRSYDNQVKQDIETINLALCRLDAILEMLRDSKQIKSTDKTMCIFAIADNIINTVRCFNIGKIDVRYEHEEILKKFAVDKISNGMFLNMLQIMVNNSVEAKATLITFNAKIISHNTLEVYIKDNGRGIRDKFNRIVKNSDDIYKYGYSTKNKNGEAVVGKSKWRYFLSLLGLKINSISAIRGIGLNLNKQLLGKIGGDISVVETSQAGTTFKLTLPVIKVTNNKEEH